MTNALKLTLINFFLLFALINLFPMVQAQTLSPPGPVTLTDAQAEYSLGLPLAFLASPTRQLTFEQMTSIEYQNHFIPGQAELFNLGLLYGFLLALIAYYSFLGFTTRDRGYIYFAALLISFALSQASQDGLAHQYLWPAWPNRYSIQISGFLMLITLLLFTAEFLSTRRRLPYLHQVILGLLALLGLSLVFIPFITFLTVWLRVISLPILLVVTIAGWRAWRQGYAPALYFWLACPIPILGSALLLLANLGLLASEPAPHLSWWAGVSLILFSSLALGRRINLLKTNIQQTNQELRQSQYHLRQYAERLRLMRQVDQVILTVQSPETVARITLTHLVKLIPNDWTGIIEFDFDTEEGVMLATHPAQISSMEAGKRLPLSTFWYLNHVEPGEIGLISDLQNLAAPSPTLQTLQAEGFRSMLIAPLMVQGDLIGLISLAANQPEAFTSEHIQIIQDLANSLAIALQQARLYDQVQHYANELEQRVAKRTTELMEHQALIRALVEHAPTGILVKDRQGRYILVNQQAAAYSGHTVEGMLGRTVRDLFPPEVIENTEQHDRQAISSREPIKRELVVPGEAGPQTFYTFRFPIFDQQGEILGVGLFSLDITERKQIEATARRLAEQRQYLLETSQSILSNLSLTEVVEQIQQTSRKIVAHTFLGLYWLDEEANRLYPLITSGPWDTEQMKQWIIPLGQGIVSDVVRSGRAELVNQAHLDPRSIYLEAVPVPLEHAIFVPLQIKNKVQGVFVLSRLSNPPFSQEEFELAQLYVAQIALAVHNARLFEQVEQARQAAEEASRAKSRFLAHMSHEFRTPLNVILGYIQLFKREPGLTIQQQAWLTTVYQSGLHLLTLINDVLDLSKIEANRVELIQANFDLSAFLKIIVGMIQVRAEAKQITFIFQPYDFSQNRPVDRLPAEIYTDETRLRQVLINLLGNAVKFTETGSVIFKVGPVVSTTNQDTLLRFQVEDTGPGIAPEHLELIFEPFQQLDTFQYPSEGTGLGLTISRNLLEKMGSKLYMTSKLGQGSIFWFDLDISQERHLGLEWLSPEITPAGEPAKPLPEPIIPPPDWEIKRLHEMAMIGDVEGILKQLALIEQMEAGYSPFVNRLRHFTENFELLDMKAFIDRYLP